MSRHRHRANAASAAESVAALVAMREQLAKDYSLSADDPRVAQASIVRLNQRAWEQQILIGRPVPSIELQAYTNVIAQLLGPPPAPALRVSFVYTCLKCKAESATDPEPDKPPVISEPAVPAMASESAMVADVNFGSSGPRLNLPAGRDYIGGYGRFDSRG